MTDAHLSADDIAVLRLARELITDPAHFVGDRLCVCPSTPDRRHRVIDYVGDPGDERAYRFDIRGAVRRCAGKESRGYRLEADLQAICSIRHDKTLSLLCQQDGHAAALAFLDEVISARRAAA